MSIWSTIMFILKSKRAKTLAENARLAKQYCEDNDYDKAFKYLQKADQTDSVIQCNLGNKYEFGCGVKKNLKKAFRWYQKAAKQNFPEAQFNLGEMYRLGQGVRQDDTEAFKWTRKAAEQDHLNAQFNLGIMYYTGQGVEKDYAEAFKWYQEVAEQGDPSAQLNLGLMYESGQGVKKDLEKAVELYQELAGQDDPRGQCCLGVMYESGQGVDKDYIEAVKWYRAAADQGNAKGQHYLGAMYQTGKGVEQDDKKAVEWFQKAADQGNANGQCKLGIWYLIKQNIDEAKKWLLKATQQGKSTIVYDALIWLLKETQQGKSTVVSNTRMTIHNVYEKNSDFDLTTKIVEVIHYLVFHWPTPIPYQLNYLLLSARVKKHIKDQQQLKELKVDTITAIQNLQDRCMDLLDYLSQPPKRSYVWHYTKQAVLKSIAKSKSLWLHPIDCQTDPEDGCFLYQAFRSTEDDEEFKRCMDKLYQIDYLDDKGESVIIPEEMGSLPFTFMASLSEKGDTFPMWNSNYAENNHGCAIGIHKDIFKSQVDNSTQTFTTLFQFMSLDFMSKDKKERGSTQEKDEGKKEKSDKISLKSLGLFKILYLPRNSDEKWDSYLDTKGIEKFQAIQQAIKSFIKVVSSDSIKMTSNNLTSWIYAYLLPIKPLIKCDDFFYEAEYRLLGFVNKTDPIIKNPHNQLYVETESFLFNQSTNQEQRECIHMGPAVSKSDRIRFKQDYGIHIPFEHSNVKYRNQQSIKDAHTNLIKKRNNQLPSTQ